MAVKKKKVVVKKVVKSPKRASVSGKKAVVKKPVAKTVTKKDSAVSKSSGVKGEVVPKVLTGEGLRRRRIAALKNKK